MNKKIELITPAPHQGGAVARSATEGGKKATMLCIALFLAACGGTERWGGEYSETAVRAPTSLYGGSSQYGGNIAVLLPDNDMGRGMEKSVEIALNRFRGGNVTAEFYPISSDQEDARAKMLEALSGKYDIAIGPLFSNDVKFLRSAKDMRLPVLSFTTDRTALGSGAFSMSLLAGDGIESSLFKTTLDKRNGVFLFAPDTDSGRAMAGRAIAVADRMNINIFGLEFYVEGNAKSIEQSAKNAAMFEARGKANTRAREVLSDILLKETLSEKERESLTAQLEKISKRETLGAPPYAAALLLGVATDSRQIVSYMRYFDADAGMVKFYGTPLWAGDEGILSDITMSGSEFSTMPEMSANFKETFERMNDRAPIAMDYFAHDAAMLAAGGLQSGNIAAHILNPSGYRGMSGVFRLRPDGTIQRPLEMRRLGGGGEPTLTRAAADNFIVPVYLDNVPYNVASRSIPLSGAGVNPDDFINIPERFQRKYKSKAYGASSVLPVTTTITFETNNEVFEVPQDEPEMPDATAAPTEINKPEQIERKLIDSTTY